MVNRVHEYLDPSPLTRLLSMGRQMRKVRDQTMTLVHSSKAAKLLGTTRVKVFSVSVLSDGTIIFGVTPADPAEATAAGLPTPVSAMVNDVEFE
jgi:hypothetical protein